MPLITAAGPDTYLIDFRHVKRDNKQDKAFLPDLITGLFTQKRVVVDAYAIAQGVIAVLRSCPFRTATLAPQVWNDYQLMLSPGDISHIKTILPSIYRDMMPLLYEEMVRLHAVTVGEMVVRIVEDESDDESKQVKPGMGILKVEHREDKKDHSTKVDAREITIRLDRGSESSPNSLTTLVPCEPTERIEDPFDNKVAVLHVPPREFSLQAGIRYIVGREHPGAPSEHIALPNAGSRINRRQFTMLLEGEDGKIMCEITREPVNSNPVIVAGQPLAAGQVLKTHLPVDIILSGGDMRISVRLPGGPGPVTASA